MSRIHALPALILTLLFLAQPALAADKKELRKQRQQAQKERQLEKTERSSQNRENIRALNTFARELDGEYRDKLAELNTEFQLREVELKAAYEAKVATAEAEYQKKLYSLFLTPKTEMNQQTVKKLQADAKAYSDELFALKKQAAEKVHQAWLDNEVRKNALLDEKDNRVLQKGDELGLNQDFSPILATPIGGGLTRSEERWNQSEEKEVAKLKEQNQKALSKYRNGAALRDLELNYAREDFRLEWEEKAEIQALDANLNFYNALLMKSGEGQFDQQAFLDQLAEDGKKKNLIKIKYKKIADKNRILRRKEKRAL